MIPLVKVRMPPREQLMPALERVLYGGMIAEGEEVYAFEREFAEQFGLPNVLAMSSGTGALHVAFLVCGVSPGDEVITTAMTAEPTNTTILQIGARPVFADVEPDTGNLAPAAVERAITPATKAICVVHYAGYPADMTALRAIADRHGIALIEDCAHALGARIAGVPVGTIGDAAIFSFQAIKHMTSVDGGMLALRDPARLDLARRLRWFGLRKGVPRTEVDITTPGFKYNMNNVTAVVGRHQLPTIGEAIARHIENGRFYDRAFAQTPGAMPAHVAADSEPSYWLYTLLCDDAAAVEAALVEAGITASKLHRPNHLHSVLAPYAGSMPGLDHFYGRLLHVPCGWWVSDADRQRIVDIVTEAAR
ncbi:DegT/DnrJ/EryC1/StrS family aminotransferase [Sphingomonas sp. 2R-10]|uniref:DegT/DnrJ/EryC1/StrS family aminotransferase n=1 Tax=Sphingomonas sp. 2R-10 TaxID=3045148 RepID=UPI0024B974B4|nr:DegT/DnrJ/EryC1/StrS family aminotransferase [Sphingomonas sp. 2R-10]MDJ0276773.1 DegT/DnrJ/EryC1/StrS family aminotransferase [Sphingomonas sp. 2R-10]